MEGGGSVNNHQEVLLALSKRRHTTSHQHMHGHPNIWFQQQITCSGLISSCCQPPRAFKGRWCVRLSLTGCQSRLTPAIRKNNFPAYQLPWHFRIPRQKKKKKSKSLFPGSKLLSLESRCQECLIKDTQRGRLAAVKRVFGIYGYGYSKNCLAVPFIFFV